LNVESPPSSVEHRESDAGDDEGGDRQPQNLKTGVDDEFRWRKMPPPDRFPPASWTAERFARGDLPIDDRVRPASVESSATDAEAEKSGTRREHAQPSRMRHDIRVGARGANKMPTKRAGRLFGTVTDSASGPVTCASLRD
jgi:hypothetical protein